MPIVTKSLHIRPEGSVWCLGMWRGKRKPVTEFGV